jgi:lysophospholipase L1-like esterase
MIKFILILVLAGTVYLPSICFSAERFSSPIIVGDSWSNAIEDWPNYTNTVIWNDYWHHGISGEWITAKGINGAAGSEGIVVSIIGYLDQHPEADSIIVQGGINDFASFVDADTVKSALEFIVAEAKARTNIVDIIVMSPGPYGTLYGSTRQTELEEYVGWLPGFCEIQAITCYNTYEAVGHPDNPRIISDGTDGAPDYSEDGLHLNLEGAAKVGADIDFLIEAIRREPVQLRIDVSPWSSGNIVLPASNNLIAVAVMGSNTATGDAVDFDATQVDPASLKFGWGEAQNLAAPWVGDFDGDTNIDVAFGFRTQATGILCGDTEVTLDGETYSGELITGTDTIDASECISTGCHP